MNLSRGASPSTAVAAWADTQPEVDVCVALCTLAGVEADNKAKVALAGGYETGGGADDGYAPTGR